MGERLVVSQEGSRKSKAAEKVKRGENVTPEAGAHEKVRESMRMCEGVGVGLGMIKRMPDVEGHLVLERREFQYGKRAGRTLEDQVKTT